MAKYECKVCGYIYNEQYAGAPFSETDSCPICGAEKTEFYFLDADGNHIEMPVEDKEVEETAQVSEEASSEAKAEAADEVVEESADEVAKDTASPIAAAPVVEPLFGIKEEPKPEAVKEPEPVMDQNRFNGFAIEKRQEFWKVDEKTIEEANKESIETYYGDTEPVGMNTEEDKEPEPDFRPLWRTGEGTGTVQTVITPEAKEPTVEKPVFEEVEKEAPFFEEVKVEEATEEAKQDEPVFEEIVIEEPVIEEVKAAEDEDLFEFVEIPKEDTDGLDSVAFAESFADTERFESADVVSVESMVNETFFDDDEETADEEIASEFVEIVEESEEAEEIEEPAAATEPEAVVEPEEVEEPEAVIEAEEVEEAAEAEEVVEQEAITEVEEVLEPEVITEVEEAAETEEASVEPADGQAMTDEELYAEIFGQPYVPPVVEEVVEETANEEIASEEPVVEESQETVEDIVENIIEDIVEDSEPSDEEVEIEFYDADEGVEEIIFEGESSENATPVASEDSFEEVIAPEPEISYEDVEEVVEESAASSEEMVVYSMLKGGMKYSILCDEQAKKVFTNFPADDNVSNGLENIILLPAQLNPLPLPANAEVDTTTILGALTACPVEVLQPFCFSKLFLWGEHIPNNENPEEYNNQAFVLVKGKNGHIPNVSSKAELKEEVEIARERFHGTPVGIDLIAGRVEQDLEACVYANMDFVILNDVSSRILPYAIRKAKNYLNKVNAKLDLLVCVDALKDAQELAKLLALGADFVLVERGFDLEVANKITEDLKEIARSTGHDNVHDINMFDICTVDSDIATYTDIAHI